MPESSPLSRQGERHETSVDVETRMHAGGDYTWACASCLCGWTFEGDEADARDAAATHAPAEREWTITLTPGAYEHGPVHPEHPLRGLDHACDVFEYLDEGGGRVTKEDQRRLAREARKVLALFAPGREAHDGN